ncbi:thiol peroxidase (plasmid) [Vibrio coralliilyticus]|uniref:thiol peroxidase n=1 Tax=Vibrio coralliilyticus TaxID=190893 RepID=UPI0005128D82|nr:thiol peroxidase [Vibrio coralliilyticus]AIS58292.1 thiol peroxidase [Vibrio coralliilyticus]
MSVTFLGNPVTVAGNLPQQGQRAAEFTLCDQTLADIGADHFTGKKLILNIFPSVDTPTCADSVRAFNEAAKSLDNTVVLCVSADLPFALARFVEQHQLDQVAIGSCFRSPTFAHDYGLAITEGPLRGLASRAVVVLDEQRQVVYVQRVSEIADEPDYSSAVAAVKGA